MCFASCRQSDAYEPIQRLPATDATQLDLPKSYPTRIGSRLPPSVLPPTGSDLDILSPSQAPPIQRDFSPVAPNYTDEYPGPLFPDSQPTPRKLSRHKKGFFQKLLISGTWLSGGTVDDMGITELEALLTVAMPLPTKEHPLLATTGFEARFLHGPQAPDLPGEVYSWYGQYIWVPKLSQRWTAILGIEPGLYSDFQDGDADGFRLLGRGLIRYQWIPDQFEIIAGVLYLDRDDVKILPAGGIIWSPNDWVRYEVLFPKPKLAHRVCWDGYSEYWIYLSGEFGGDTWAVQRASGTEDRLTLRDIRVMLGVERKLDGGAGAALEAGYVFGRRIEYASTPTDVELPSTIMIRGVVSY